MPSLHISSNLNSNVSMFHKYLVKIHEHEYQNDTLNRNYFASVCMLGWAKPDLWGLGGES